MPKNEIGEKILYFCSVVKQLCMNTDLYKSLLERYHNWVIANADTVVEESKEREKLCERVRSYTSDDLLSLTEEGLYDLMANLWAMRLWGNKQYYVNEVIKNNGMELLRHQLHNLLYGQADIVKRWDDFRNKVKGIGPAIMSELLCKLYPTQYVLWNSKAYNGFIALSIPKVPKSNVGIDGKRYAYLSEVGRELIAKAQEWGYKEINDLMALDYFIWQEMQDIAPTAITVDKSDTVEISKKEEKFTHNDIRDMIKEIGNLLGFNADVEKKVADGAVVDAVWEVLIGNMGRVIYVFEVQTAGSIDSLILNLMKAKTNNKAVQGIVAVSDEKQLEKIKKEAASLPIKNDIRYWNYKEVIDVYNSLSSAFESINRLGLVPDGIK